MYKFLNVHPKGLRVGDCVKRAITTATGMDYMEVQRELNRCKKITGCSKFNDNKNWKYYVEKELKAKKLSFPAVQGQDRMNGYKFCEEFPKGHYILRMAGHLSCCIDGVIYDTWDCSDKCVYNAYKMRTPEEIVKLVEIEEKLKKDKQVLKAKQKKIKEKYASKIKPLQKKIKELEKQMVKELEILGKEVA